MKRSLRFSICAIALLSFVIASDVRADGAAEPEHTNEPQRIPAAVTGDEPTSKRLIIPPFVRDRRGDVTTTALFPFYFERASRDSIERFVLPYYYRRGPKLQADVALGLVWSLRGPERNTFVLPPFYSHRRGKDWGVGLLPLFSTGVFGGHSHTVIPPLLTWFDGDGEKHRRFVGPYYDVKRNSARWRGLFPLFWSKQDEQESFVVVPPLFFRFAESDPLAVTTVVPPFYHLRRGEETSWGLFPLLHRRRSPELKSTTVPLALFHHASGPKQFRLVTPLLAYFDDQREGSLLITPLYQRRRGDKNFDAVAPLFFRMWDERDASRALHIPPFYFHWEDPANRRTVLFPFFASDQHEGISDFWLTPLVGRKKSLQRDAQTWWVAPTFHWAWSENSRQFNVHPLFYLKRSPDKSHTAVAPLWFDFRNRKEQTHRFTLFPIYWDFKKFQEQKRSRVLFPLYWAFDSGKRQRSSRVVFPLYWDLKQRDRDARYQVAFPFYARSVVGDRTRHFALNTMTQKRKDKDHSWEFHFFPLLSLGGSDRGKWWSLFYGLAGYDRRGGHRRASAFWIPFELGE